MTIHIDPILQIFTLRIILLRYTLGNTEKSTNHINFLYQGIKMSLSQITSFIRFYKNLDVISPTNTKKIV